MGVDAAAICKTPLRTPSKKKDKSAKNPNEGRKNVKKNKKVNKIVDRESIDCTGKDNSGHILSADKLQESTLRDRIVFGSRKQSVETL